MKKLEIIGYKRANLGKTDAREQRKEANVPCVVYGGKEHVHCIIPMIMFKKLVYTPEVHEVELNIEGDIYRCILQEIQFHPVNEIILHADFLELNDDKPVKIEVPLRLVGAAPGVQKGGKLFQKIERVKVKALPKDLPDFVEVSVAELELGKSVRISDAKVSNFEILTNAAVTVATVTVPRELKGKTEGA
jgi:large subunit ribosomal protein L25